MDNQCENCGRTFKTLTKEGLCAYCYFDTYESWAKEFTEDNKKAK